MSTSAERAPAARDDVERLRFRRQFLLGGDLPEELPGWRRLTVDGRTRLAVHPDLEVSQATAEGRSVTLLGFVLDPDRPAATNAELVAGLVRDACTCDDLIARTARLGGRWVLVVADGRRTELFHDAAGQRQVYFTDRSACGELLCASQPGLLARTLRLERDAEAVAFMASRGDEDGAVYWMPGDRSMYREVRALLPNHALDLGTGRVRRYWPARAPTGPAPADPVESCAALLGGLGEAVRRRHALAVPMTAGWDSRLVLALLRPAVRELHCFTLTYPTAPADSADVVVPARLLARLGVPHHVVPYPRVIDPELRDVVRTNLDAAKEAWCGDAQALRAHLPEGRVCVTGDVAEIAKCHYRLPRRGGRRPSARELARLSGIGEHPFALAAFEEWLSGADAGPLDLLDLFCWEQVAGRWQALIRAEHDVVHETFAPLDCRALLAMLLSVDEAERRPPEHRLFRALLERLWGETLLEPINPRERLRPRALLGLALRKLHLYALVPERVRALGRRRPGG